MKCPFCGHAETQVIETRLSEDGVSCAAAAAAALVTSASPPTNDRGQLPGGGQKDGRRIDYDPAKLRASLALACASVRSAPNRSTPRPSASRKNCSTSAREVPTHQLGELVMRELKKLDKVAYVRFASVYRSFEDIDEFRTGSTRCAEDLPPARRHGALRGRSAASYPSRAPSPRWRPAPARPAGCPRHPSLRC